MIFFIMKLLCTHNHVRLIYFQLYAILTDKEKMNSIFLSVEIGTIGESCLQKNLKTHVFNQAQRI